MKYDIYDLNRHDLINIFKEQNISSFRAMQVWEYLYGKRVDTFSEMAELNGKTAALLEEKFINRCLKEKLVQKSEDGTIKFLYKLEDNNIIETVMMPHPYGISLCVTTQVGCNMGCSFCASGLNRKVRDLKCAEILGQVLNVQDYLDKEDLGKITNIVVMGIGEPLDNFKQLSKFIEIIIDHKGMAIPGKHITISTCGLTPKIRAFADKSYPVNLAISLHAPNNEIRNKIMQINRVYPLEEIINALSYYYERTKRRITIEYILLHGINDGDNHALELVQLLRNLKAKFYINLIPYNPVDERSQYSRSPKERVLLFYDILKRNQIHCQIRQEYGTDIEAACGQLRIEYLK